MDCEGCNAQAVETKTPTGMILSYCNNHFCNRFGKFFFHHNGD